MRENIGGEAILKGKVVCSVLDILSLKCLLNIQVKDDSLAGNDCKISANRSKLDIWKLLACNIIWRYKFKTMKSSGLLDGLNVSSFYPLRTYRKEKKIGS